CRLVAPCPGFLDSRQCHCRFTLYAALYRPAILRVCPVVAMDRQQDSRPETVDCRLARFLLHRLPTPDSRILVISAYISGLRAAMRLNSHWPGTRTTRLSSAAARSTSP